MHSSWLPLLLGAATALGGCGSGSTGAEGAADARVGPDAPTVVGTATRYVMSSIKVGKTASEAKLYGFDLSGDGQPDNTFGGTAATVATLAGFDVDALFQGAVTSGGVVLLDKLTATGLTAAASATWQVYLGNAQANPDLSSGNGKFTVSTASPTDAVLLGSIAGGVFTGGPTTIALELALVPGRPPYRVHLLATRLQATVTDTGCTAGKAGGGIPDADVKSVIIPVLAAALTTYVQENPTKAGLILGFFDTNQDGTISTDELTSNVVVKVLLAPDLDLLDASGKPGTDGVNDSLSIGLGFTCTKASF